MIATNQIKHDLYKNNIRSFKPVDKSYRQLTAYSPYDNAFFNP